MRSSTPQPSFTAGSALPAGGRRRQPIRCCPAPSCTGMPRSSGWMAVRFLIQRWHYDHPEIPDAIAVTGVADGKLSMRYFDYRGVYRVYAVSLEDPGGGSGATRPGSATVHRHPQRRRRHDHRPGPAVPGRVRLGGRPRDHLPAKPGKARPASGRPFRSRRDGAPGDRSQPLHDAGHDGPRRPAIAVAGVLHPRAVLGLLLVFSPEAQHSRNLAERPGAEIVIFDSTAPAGEGEAVYITATAEEIHDDDLDAVCPEAFRTAAGARRFTPADLRDDLRLYVAHAHDHARSTSPRIIPATAAASTPASRRSRLAQASSCPTRGPGRSAGNGPGRWRSRARDV